MKLTTDSFDQVQEPKLEAPSYVSVQLVVDTFVPEIAVRFRSSIEFIMGRFEKEWAENAPSSILQMTEEELQHYLNWLKAGYSRKGMPGQKAEYPMLFLNFDQQEESLLNYLVINSLFYEGRYVGLDFDFNNYELKVKRTSSGADNLLLLKLKKSLGKDFSNALTDVQLLAEFGRYDVDDKRSAAGKIDQAEAGNLLWLMLDGREFSLEAVLDVVAEYWLTAQKPLIKDVTVLLEKILQVAVDRFMWKLGFQHSKDSFEDETIKDLASFLGEIASIAIWQRLTPENQKYFDLHYAEKNLTEEQDILFEQFLSVLKQKFNFNDRQISEISNQYTRLRQRPDPEKTQMMGVMPVLVLEGKFNYLVSVSRIHQDKMVLPEFELIRKAVVKKTIYEMQKHLAGGGIKPQAKHEFTDYFKQLEKLSSIETDPKILLEIYRFLEGITNHAASKNLASTILIKMCQVEGGFEYVVQSNAMQELIEPLWEDNRFKQLEKTLIPLLGHHDGRVSNNARLLLFNCFTEMKQDRDEVNSLSVCERVFVNREDLFTALNISVIRSYLKFSKRIDPSNAQQNLLQLLMYFIAQRWNLSDEELCKFFYLVAVDPIDEKQVEFLIKRYHEENINSLDINAVPERDIQGLIAEIIENRTSHISSDGHVLSVSDGEYDSPLSKNILEIRIKRNSETGNPPRGLACNVGFYFKNGLVRYYKLTVQGDLIQRVLDAKSGHEIAQKSKSELGQEANELHYLILQKLKVVYVRKPDRPSPVPAQPAVTPVITGDAGTPGQAEEEISRNSDAVLVPGVIPTVERTENEIAVDLTDLDKKALASSKRLERVRTATNRARVYGVFAPLLHGRGLPEKMSLAENENIDLYWKRTYRNGPKRGITLEYFERVLDVQKAYDQVRKGEVSIEQLFVRKSRAHIKNLPLKVEEYRVDGLPNGQKYFGLKNNQQMSEQAEEKMELFTLDEQAEELRINKQRRILTYKVLDGSTPDSRSVQRSVFESIKDGSLLKQLADTAEKKCRQELDEQRVRLREKYLEIMEPDFALFAEEMQAITVQIREELCRELAALKELQEKAYEEKKRVQLADGSFKDFSVLHLPEYGYEIHQTFSSGQFQSVEDLLTSFKAKPQK